MNTHTNSTEAISNNRGSVLIIALLLLMAVALSTVYLSLILVNEIKSTRFADNGLIANYVGETAVERALWRLQKAETDKDNNYFTDQLDNAANNCGADDGGGEGRCIGRCATDPTWPQFYTRCMTDQDCTGGDTCAPAYTGSDPERTYDYNRVMDAAFSYTKYDIPSGTSVYTKIYNPDSLISKMSTGVDRLNIYWYVDKCTAGVEDVATLTIDYTAIDMISAPDLVTKLPASSGSVTIPCGCSASTKDDWSEKFTMYLCSVNLLTPSKILDSNSSPALSGSNFYRIKFTPSGAKVRKITMDAGPSGNNVPMPSQVEVQAVGNYRESQSVVRYITTWLDYFASSTSLFYHDN